jgi:hypothetical protein
MGREEKSEEAKSVVLGDSGYGGPQKLGEQFSVGMVFVRDPTFLRLFGK